MRIAVFGAVEDVGSRVMARDHQVTAVMSDLARILVTAKGE